MGSAQKEQNLVKKFKGTIFDTGHKESFYQDHRSYSVKSFLQALSDNLGYTEKSSTNFIFKHTW